MNKVFLATVIADGLFLASGILVLAYSLVIRSQNTDNPKDGQHDGKQVTLDLIHQRYPVDAAIVNAAFILVTFIATLPGLFMPARKFLKISGYMVTFCAIFTLCVGVSLWVMTLRIREQFFDTYIAQEPQIHSMIQQSFECCGYFNSSSPAFVRDSVCTSPAAASLLRGCAGSLSGFANQHIDLTFTVVFGIVGIDALFVLAIACLLKDRKERERYRHIDEKTGFRSI